LSLTFASHCMMSNFSAWIFMLFKNWFCKVNDFIVVFSFSEGVLLDIFYPHGLNFFGTLPFHSVGFPYPDVALGYHALYFLDCAFLTT
ncbi:MAG TPA: hypothetical protein VFU05_18540, partial [Cyclobacteriaceae bacterium]|nr:hypothetical protein [Cyclobacteriaceae bacterium]